MKTIRILIRPSNIKDQYLEEGTGDPIEDAIYKRNLMVESMYNIKISATPSSHSNYETDALNSILAGDDAYEYVESERKTNRRYQWQRSKGR